jgi:hypothetical protein
MVALPHDPFGLPNGNSASPARHDRSLGCRLLIRAFIAANEGHLAHGD